MDGSRKSTEELGERARVIWEFAANEALEALAVRGEFLAALRGRIGEEVDEDAARAIFSELVANVARHAPGPISITVALDGARVILTISDTGPGFVFSPSLPRNVNSEGGRGLFIVSQFAGAVGAKQRDETRASVSAMIPIRRLE